MTNQLPHTMRQLRSMVTADGTLELSIATVDIPQPQPHEVLVRIEAAPINPSDLGLLLATADLDTARSGGTADNPVVTASIPPQTMRGLAGRTGQSMPVGNEGAGTVVAAGSDPEAQALMGKTVAIIGGATYAEYRCVAAGFTLELPDGTEPAEAASCFVNPLTALGMVETMRMEGHSALVHTAAASNLGQMLQKICLTDGVPLVNIVRKPEQEELLRGIGATHVCNMSLPTFMDDLTAALVDTGATLAFDAIGGGKQVGQILACMEVAANASATEFSRYGSTVHKQVYIYGGLDRGPTEFARNFGMAWGIGGWLLTPFLGKIGLDGIVRLRSRVVSELRTTFASHYTDEVSLAGALNLDALKTYARQATGQKFLIRPAI
ncbi:MAG TPA: zinc-binding dehydrogenase [Ilumatobacteraceae bacterium]|nr:zinc-binding dehydrogenase [Ilumatobacteraceae bacterium]